MNESVAFPVAMAFDPGGTTGVALRMSNGLLTTATCTDAEKVYDLVKSAAETNTVIICERFRAHRIDQYGLHTIRLCGGIQALCYAFNLTLVEHVPDKRRPFLDIAKSKLSESGNSVVIHEVDAAAHLLAWEFDNDIFS